MSETIAAYSGGALPAAIGICRISGEETFAVMDQLFRPLHGGAMSGGPFSKMRYGEVIDSDGRVLDICLAVCYRGPQTYTGEDSAEIFCHGSQAIVARILSRCYESGARPARAGEFTKRAFLAGKLDLAGAEAVADLIYAPSAEAAKNASALLKGGVSQQIRRMQTKIMDLLTHFYAVCDYPDEDIDPFLQKDAQESLEEIARELERLFAGYERSRTLTEGLPVTILGKPNVGKSSLLNALAGYDRAIVTEEAGTTRDIVTETISCGGTLLRLSDTAGLRSAESLAERIGVEKAKESAAQSAVLLCVFDASRPLEADDETVLHQARGKTACAIVNKTDLCGEIAPEIRGAFETIFPISAQTGRGIEPLVEWLAGLAKPAGDEVLVTSARQAELMRRAAQDCRRAAESAALGMTADAFLSDAERAGHLLSELLGESVSEDIVHGIFSRFCVGK